MMLIKKRFNLGIVFLMLCIFLSACGSSGPKVLVFVRDGSYDPGHIDEVRLMLRTLEEAGILAVVATQSEDSYQGAESSLKSDILMQDVNVADYDGFLLPCTAEFSSDEIEDIAIAMVTEAAAQNKPIAAQYYSVGTLGYAGLLDGVHYACQGNKFPEGIYEGDGVVQDGNIITSGCCLKISRGTGCADGTVELTKKLIESVTP